MVFALKALFFPSKDITFFIDQQHFDLDGEYQVKSEQKKLNNRNFGDVAIDNDCEQEEQEGSEHFPEGWVFRLNIIIFFVFLKVNYGNDAVVHQKEKRVNVMIVDEYSEKQVS